MSRRIAVLVLLLLAVLAAGCGGKGQAGRDADRPAAEADRGVSDGGAGEGSEAEREREHAGGPESNEDIAKFNGTVAAHIGADGPHQLSRAVAAEARLARANRATPIPGTGGKWTPYGKGPLRFDSTDYPAGNGDGFGRVNGRINDFAYVPQTKKLYAAVAQGGLWESSDLGKNWTSIGDNLPIGSMGAVAYTTAGGGTLMAATGDMAFSNDYAGVGVFWSTDDGGHWTKATGIPDGALSFRLAVDPTDPSTVYYASGLGLFRSTDAGRSFTNVKLPTSDACAGDSFAKNCFFANIVTDVAVQPTDTLGHKGGAVVAAVGWRAGQRPNFNNVPDAPNNGIYRSDTGAPGTFTKVPDSAGFTPTDHAGRVSLGTTTGDGQDSRYLYAVSQDSVAFGQSINPDGDQDIPLVGTPSVLDAVYVSPDFGKTWRVLESRKTFLADQTSGSSLAALAAAGIGPGYQVTYNEFIKPDPTRTSPNGIPTRVILGMEEVWQTKTTNGVPIDGSVPDTPTFSVIGQYTANGAACLVQPEVCGAKQQATPGNTTTHPDQHGVTLVPDGSGGVTLVVGNDGGAYTQHVGTAGEFNQLSWGNGANEGFHTLLPYGAAMAKDGTVYAGLQDNGELKITPDGTQYAVYVGDGTFALVDPDKSKVAYDELPNAGMNVSTDGGATWADMSPASITDADFVAPMVMDPKDANHLAIAGRQIFDTTQGPNTGTGGWNKLFDLGTHQHPGDDSATKSNDDPANHATALQLIGDDGYAGFCGSCDPVKLKQIFHNGIATSVGANGWHIAAANGLPNRLITSVAMDPADHHTVYVTLGQSSTRYFAPLGAQGEDASSSAGGFLYKSTDAGEHFTDITGNLPKIQTSWVLVRNGQLVVADAVGVFASRTTDGKTFAPLGNDLPPVAVYQISLKPGDDSTLVAATYGRGVYTYKFADATGVTPGKCKDTTKPSVRKVKVVVAAKRRLRVSGQVTDKGCGFRGVRILISRKGMKQISIRVRHPKKFTLRSKRLKPGAYKVTVRAIDRGGNRRAVTKKVRVR